MDAYAIAAALYILTNHMRFLMFKSVFIKDKDILINDPNCIYLMLRDAVGSSTENNKPHEDCFKEFYDIIQN